jgi:type IV pilus assembly protein PilY1
MTWENQTMGSPSHQFTKAASALYGIVLVLLAAPANSDVPLADAPLFLTVTVPVNITLTLDDSGSMSRAWVPENCADGGDINGCSGLANRYEKASNNNLIYYNPDIVYPAPKKVDGSLYTTSFTAAWRNGFDPVAGTTVDLSNNYRPTSSIHVRNTVQTEWYMPHYSVPATPTLGDVKCATTASTPRACQIRDPNGTVTEGGVKWRNLGTNCSTAATAADRTRSCAGTWSTANNNNDRVPVGVPAYYYVYDGSLCANGPATSNACYKMVIVSATSGPPGRADERQNFANWFSFARTRNLATVTSASLAFADLPTTVRVAWQALNSCRESSSTLLTTNCEGWKENFSVSNAIKPFVDSTVPNVPTRTNFYRWLAQLPTNGGTPLPQAMQRVGEYYKKTGDNSPYDNDLLASGGGQYSCRRNFHVMMTDGIWNATTATTGNKDGSTIALPDTTDFSQYSPRAPYKDDQSDTLADVAFKYWITDLNTSLANDLAGLPDAEVSAADKLAAYWDPRNDPATWQHMVNYTIGLGLSGFLKTTTPQLEYTGSPYGGSYPDLASGALSWPAASTAGTSANVADLWHAAINSRGLFFNANDPASLSSAFKGALEDAVGEPGSAASLSANSTSIQPNDATIVYQARFNQDWSGSLIAYPVNTSGVQQPLWDASKLIPAHNVRKIFTYNGTKGVPFLSCTNDLNADQQAALNTSLFGAVDGLCQDRLDWLRGSSAKEARMTGGIFRNRTNVMGDIINSDPAYVKNVDYGYAEMPSSQPGQSTYAKYVSDNESRQAMVYIGSNDGRMYGIRADKGAAESGVEQFSYIPAGVYHNLSRLTDPAYSHKYYADGAITASDAYLNASWKTVVVAGLNAGGKSIYALDVTSPTGFSEAKVMWEFMEKPEKDINGNDLPTTLGLTFSQPQVGVLEDGTWVAVFGNGYNSETGGAWLYVVDLLTGNLIEKIKASDEDGVDEGNGLSTPLLVDTGGNKLIDTVYAGDLLGNMWKFDLAGAKSGKVAVGGSPLFKASADGSGVPPQPITSQPKVGGHALGGKIVVFGTGRYLTDSDVTNHEIQTFYGIWDKGAETVTTVERDELQEQQITTQKPASGLIVRTISDEEVDWGLQKGWYLDLVDVAPAPPRNPQAIGERVVSTPIIRGDRAIFVTIIPSTDACDPGGTSWLMEVNLATGGTFDYSILDINRDNEVNELDLVGGEVVTGQKLDTLGISKTPVILDDPPGGDKSGFNKLLTGTTGKIEIVRNGGGPNPPNNPNGVSRRSWIQIR